MLGFTADTQALALTNSVVHQPLVLPQGGALQVLYFPWLCRQVLLQEILEAALPDETDPGAVFLVMRDEPLAVCEVPHVTLVEFADGEKGLRDLGFELGTPEAQSAIIAVIMPDLERGAMMWQALLEEGLYVNLARPPATPANMTLLRCSLCAEHTSEQVDQILGMFEAAGKAVGAI